MALDIYSVDIRPRWGRIRFHTIIYIHRIPSGSGMLIKPESIGITIRPQGSNNCRTYSVNERYGSTRRSPIFITLLEKMYVGPRRGPIFIYLCRYFKKWGSVFVSDLHLNNSSKL